MTLQRRGPTPTTVKVMTCCLALIFTLTACSVGPAAAPAGSSTTRSEIPNIGSPTPTQSKTVPTSAGAAFTGVDFDVAFSFDYPATWSVTNTAAGQNGGFYVIIDEAGARVASLHVEPQLTAYPCEGVCGNMPVSYFGEVPGQGQLGENSFSVQTKAMDLTTRQDLREANGWPGNVRLTVGVVGKPSTTPEEDPFHFRTGAGVNVPSSSSPVRPIIFAADRYFESMIEARAYTTTSEYKQIRTMLQSLEAEAAIRADSDTPPTLR